MLVFTILLLPFRMLTSAFRTSPAETVRSDQLDDLPNIISPLANTTIWPEILPSLQPRAASTPDPDVRCTPTPSPKACTFITQVRPDSQQVDFFIYDNTCKRFRHLIQYFWPEFEPFNSVRGTYWVKLPSPMHVPGLRLQAPDVEEGKTMYPTECWNAGWMVKAPGWRVGCKFLFECPV
jgi:hypothetical protein